MFFSDCTVSEQQLSCLFFHGYNGLGRDFHSLSLSLHFNGHFPDGSGLTGTRKSPFWILLELRMTEMVVSSKAIRRTKLQIVTNSKRTSSFLQAGCPSCHSTNSKRQSSPYST